jgi:hypothetical protein
MDALSPEESLYKDGKFFPEIAMLDKDLVPVQVQLVHSIDTVGKPVRNFAQGT